eukprot:g22319.t1
MAVAESYTAEQNEAWLRPENQHLMAPPYLCPAISTRSKATDSRRSRPWHWLTILAGCRVARVSRVARRFRVFGISDVHTDWDENLRQLEELPVGPYSEDALLLAGDVSHDFQKVSQTLQLLKQRFKYLFFVPGNHDLYVRHEDGVDSLVKHERLLNECARLGAGASWVDV